MDQNPRNLFNAYLEDGLVEAAMGAAFLALGAWFLLEDLVFMAWMMPWMFLALLLPSAKKKIVAPRGGVVDMPAQEAPQRLRRMILLGLGTLVLIGLVFATGAQRDAAWFQSFAAGIRWFADHFAACLGAVFCAVLATLGIKGATQHLTLIGLLALVAGVAADMLITSGRVGGLVVGIAVGIPLLVAGLVRFRRYCETNPIIDKELMA